MALYLFTQKSFDEVKGIYMNLEKRFNRLAGYFSWKDCKEGMSYLDYAEVLIGRMGYESGDLSKNMGDCRDALNDLKRMILRYEMDLKGIVQESQKHLAEDDEMRLTEDELNSYTFEHLKTGNMEGFNRVMLSGNVEAVIETFAGYVNWVKAVHEKTKMTPEKVLTSVMGLDPEEVRLFLDAIEEDKIIQIDDIKYPQRRQASGMEAPVTF